MIALRRLWIPALVGLLVAALVGPVGAEEKAGEPRAISRTMTVPGAAFVPSNDDLGYQIDGYQVVVVGPSSNGTFYAPLTFDAPEVKIRKLVLYAYDNGGGAVCVELSRSTPTDGNRQDMGNVCSTGDTTGVRRFIQTSLDIRWVKEKHGPYLELYIPGTYSSGYSFYGLQIFYTIP